MFVSLNSHLSEEKKELKENPGKEIKLSNN